MVSAPVRPAFSIFLGLCVVGSLPTRAAPDDSSSATARPKTRGDNSRVLVTVNGVPITENRVELYRLIHRMKSPIPPETQKKIVDQLVENELMRSFLTERRADVEPKQVKEAVQAIKKQIKSTSVEPDKALRRLGFTDANLERELSLPWAWGRHFSRIITQQAIRDEFDRHRTEYDGTEVCASQIFLKLSQSDAGPNANEAKEKLAKIRAEILAKKLSFADAARQNSEAPSAAAGGSVGCFAFQGKMPTEISRVAFSLKPGEISQPFRTRYGVHLYTVTSIRPGNLSLEDVRYLVIRRLRDELWEKLVAQARKNAKIEWPKTAP